MLFFMLFKNRARLTYTGDPDQCPRSKKFEPGFMDGDKRMYATLVADYREGLYYWETVEMGKKFVLCSLLMLIDRGSTLQVFVGSIFSFCTFSIQTLVRPYKRPDDNVLKGCAEAQLFCTFLGCLVLRLETADTTGYDVVLLVLNLLVYPLPFLVVTGAPACWNLRHFLSRSPGRSQTPVHPLRNHEFLDDQMRDLDGKPIRADLDEDDSAGTDGGGSRGSGEQYEDDKVSTRQARGKADWKTVTRAGQLKWTKTYRVGQQPGAGGSSGGGSVRSSGSRESSHVNGNASKGGGLSPSKESAKRSPGKLSPSGSPSGTGRLRDVTRPPAKLKALPKRSKN